MSPEVIDTVFGIALSLIAVAATIAAFVIAARTLVSMREPRPGYYDRRHLNNSTISDYARDLNQKRGLYASSGHNIVVVDGQLYLEAEDESVASSEEDPDIVAASAPLSVDEADYVSSDQSDGWYAGEIGSEPQQIWYIPHVRSPHFFARESMLDKLADILSSGRMATLTQDFHIIGGAGKTQLAVEYAYCSADSYPIVWWIRAGDQVTLTADYAALAAAMGFRLPANTPLLSVCSAVRHALEQRGGWLLIFDNVSSPDDVTNYIPRSGNGHVIITTCCPDWGVDASGLLMVKEFDRLDSAEFLLSRTRQSNAAQAAGIAEALGDLPLVLEVAAAYMVQSRTSLAEFLKDYQSILQDILLRGTALEYPKTLGTVMEMSLKQIERESPAAIDLLKLCSFFAADGIPLSFLRQGTSSLPASLPSGLSDPVALNNAIDTLSRYSLLVPGSDMLFIHRLIQAAMRDRIAPMERQTWIDAATQIIDSVLSSESGDEAVSPACLRLFSHMLMIAWYIEENNITSEAAVRMLNDLTHCLRACGALSNAKQIAKLALDIAENAYGLKHPWVAVCADELGSILRGLKDFAGARVCYEQALATDEVAYGLQHPNVALRLTNLAAVLHDLGDIRSARSCYERALAIDEAVYGPMHPRVADDVSSLGSAMQELGDADGARQNCDRSVKIAEGVYGSEDPKITKYVNEFGAMLLRLGDPGAALDQFERVLQIDEAAYGPNHVYIAECVRNMGKTLQELNNYQDAGNYFEQARRIDEKIYGYNSAQVAVDYDLLGGAMVASGNFAAAQVCYEKALSIDESLHSSDNLASARYAANLGFVLKKLNEPQLARPHLKRAVELFRKSIGSGNPETLAAQEMLESLPANFDERHAA